MTEPMLYSVAQTAEATGLGRTKIYDLMASGAIVAVKVGNRRLIPAESLREFVADLVAASEGATDDAVA